MLLQRQNKKINWQCGELLGKRFQTARFQPHSDRSNIFLFCFSTFDAENQEKFFLYLFISVTAGVLLCLTLVIGRLVIQKRQLKSDKKTQSNGAAGETTIPNGFSDDISEIDGDIDMTTSMPVASVSRSDVVSISDPLFQPSIGELEHERSDKKRP